MKTGSTHGAYWRHHAARLKGHGVRAAKHVHKHALSSRKKVALTSVVGVLVLVVAAQFFYPNDKVVWFAKLDGYSIGGESKEAAVRTLNEAYADTKAEVFYKDDAETPKAAPTLPEIGLHVDNAERIAAFDYPWYWRLVPSSALWYQAVARPAEPVATKDNAKLDEYMVQTFGAECVIAPVNATVELKDGTFKTVPSSDGGTCEYDELRGALAGVGATLHPAKIVVDGTTIEPTVNDAAAEVVAKQLTERLAAPIPIAVNGKDESIAADTAKSWLVFTPEEETVAYSLNEAANKTLVDTYGKNVAVAAGVSRVTTHDFVETSRVNGAQGRAINGAQTADTVLGYIKGDAAKAEVKTQAVPPSVTYTRTYSPTDAGISALLKHFAESNPGTYGISFAELSGARRHASYNGGTQFTTASTYKLFVAYSALLRVERGEWSWSDQIAGGRDLTRCFDDMIVKSDNACAEAMLRKIGFSAITNDAKAIGATSTSFLGSNGIKSTAQDQVILLSALQNNQILSQQSSRDTFLSALRRNVYRQGIPAGASGAVANKVGFMDGLLHDAGIVYSPSGTYVLVILTDGSSWANIAELTRQLEALRNG